MASVKVWNLQLSLMFKEEYDRSVNAMIEGEVHIVLVYVQKN